MFSKLIFPAADRAAGWKCNLFRRLGGVGSGVGVDLGYDGLDYGLKVETLRLPEIQGAEENGDP